MMLLTVLLAAAAAPPPPAALAGFSLKERVAEVRRLGHETPHTLTTAGEQILRFHGEAHSQGCDDATQWVFYFSRAENRLVSVTRNLEAPAPLRTLIPRSAKPVLYKTPSGYPVLRAALPDGREFVAAGARTPQDQVSQVQLIRTSDIARFYSDLRPAQ